MTLTEEQESVVSIREGRHLVLAPPGSGKTEMLSQRIRRALDAGVNPDEMLCATFTNRAAFEMRERIGLGENGVKLPEVGNLHHFCHRFLMSVGRLKPWKHVLDEVEQLSFVREATNDLRTAWKDVEDKQKRLAILEGVLACYHQKGKSPYPDVLAGVLIAHQHRLGFRSYETRSYPFGIQDLLEDGVLNCLERWYSGLKRRFQSVDFDDLVNETCLYLRRTPLAEAQRFNWVQIDEVQDLSPLQWEVVRGLTSSSSVSVYFGDAEQAIFSFLGASLTHFLSEVADCEMHYFKVNFRATPLLLEVLMRFSIGAMRSDWRFLPSPADVARANGLLKTIPEGNASVGNEVSRLLADGIAENVAVLVWKNKEADALEDVLKALPYRLVKVSGMDLFAYAPMRDFLSFVSLFSKRMTRVGWQNLLRRFSPACPSDITARHVVRRAFAAHRDPMDFLLARFPPLLWTNRSAFMDLRKALKTPVEAVLRRKRERLGFREMFGIFAGLALEGDTRYSVHELYPERARELVGRADALEVARARAFERIEVFLRYADHVYGEDRRNLETVLEEDWDRLTKLKEADLLTGDERIVISTIHKAKGRQFDAVVTPGLGKINRDDKGIEETLRLFYVAMSRAKRHLVLVSPSSEGLMSDIMMCFDKGYEGYYRQRSRGKDLSSDWLWRWERLSETYRARRCNLVFAEDALASVPHPAVKRMAIRTLRYLADGADVERRLLSCLDAAENAEVWDAVMDCARERRLESAAFQDAVRRCLAAKQEGQVLRAVFAYAVAIGSKRLVSDLLYSALPEMRVRAARALCDLGDARWVSLVSGSPRDWDRLGRIDAPEHEETIRTLLAQKARDAHERGLRQVLSKRALRR